VAAVTAVVRWSAFTKHAAAEPWLFISFSLFVVLSELFTITVPHGESEEEITFSTTFAFALLLISGPGAAVMIMAIASAVADAIRRKAALKIAFNVAQVTLSLAISGGVLAIVSDVPRPGMHPHFTSTDIPAIILAALVFFVTNHVLTGVVFALSMGERVLFSLTRDLGLQFSTASALLVLSPIVVITAHFSPLLIPMLIIPMATVYKAARQAIQNEFQALHDALTGLPNRALFQDRLKQAVLTGRRETTNVAVMIMDLDRFKDVNDTLGHHSGDELLKEIGTRLRQSLRDTDTVARLGGDEFGVVLPRLSDTAAALEVAKKVHDALEQPFELNELMLTAEASTGIAIYPEHGDDVDTLMRRADVAMYAAKEAHSKWTVYSPELDRDSAGRLELLATMRRSLGTSEEFVLFYQPKVHLVTGQVTEVEALVRWQHPTKGLLGPDLFVPLAENTGLIAPLTRVVLSSALAQCKEWQQLEYDLGVSVNLSVRNLLDIHFARLVEELLSRSEVPAEMLTLEITESSIMAEPARSIAILKALSSMGVQLAIDDFGIGYSSLSQLRRLPVNELKIDKSFVMNMELDSSDAVIVRSTVELGRSLGLEVVAEGVETDAIHRHLVDLGCNFAQGYHFSRPLPADKLIKWIQNSREEQERWMAAP
jgi:diguanylate cyclase (GGDEF)-like protein